jgi:hypothetical protein
MVEITMRVLSAGQFVTVLGQAVMVDVRVV